MGFDKCEHENCKKKLSLTDFPCKCKKRFCPIHRYPEDHLCNFDYKQTAQKYLSTNLVLVQGCKLDKIQ